MGKIFANHLSDKELISKTYQELLQNKNKQTKDKKTNLYAENRLVVIRGGEWEKIMKMVKRSKLSALSS